MTLHKLKTDPEVFLMSASDLKDYEIRFNDRDFQVGDKLELLETIYSGEEMRNGKPLGFTGQVLYREVTAILSGYGLNDGWVILSVKEV